MIIPPSSPPLPMEAAMIAGAAAGGGESSPVSEPLALRQSSSSSLSSSVLLLLPPIPAARSPSCKLTASSCLLHTASGCGRGATTRTSSGMRGAIEFVIGSHAFRRLPKDLLCFFFSTRGIESSTDPVYLGKGGQGWSEPAAMTPTDERARERR